MPNQNQDTPLPRVAVLGTGSLGKQHARLFADLAQAGAVQFTGVFDVIKETSAKIARQYNVTAFNPSAADFRRLTLESFAEAELTFAPDQRRQAIVDSWPEDVDDDAARRDWGFAPRYSLEAAFHEYLLPRIRARYP